MEAYKIFVRLVVLPATLHELSILFRIEGSIDYFYPEKKIGKDRHTKPPWSMVYRQTYRI